ncbi:MAG TPA: PKD domain-containing protein [Cyclobacteriaceae bacterium]|nr:PKD domain-containing protein [Cyclobacteriaceae bacterium]
MSKSLPLTNKLILRLKKIVVVIVMAWGLVSFSASAQTYFRDISAFEIATTPESGFVEVSYVKFGALTQRWAMPRGTFITGPGNTILVFNSNTPTTDGLAGTSITGNGTRWEYNINPTTWNLGNFFGTPYVSRSLFPASYTCRVCNEGTWINGPPDPIGGGPTFLCTGTSTRDYTMLVRLFALDDARFTFGSAMYGNVCPESNPTANVTGGITAGGALGQYMTWVTSRGSLMSYAGETTGLFPSSQFTLNSLSHGPGNIDARVTWTFTPGAWDNISSTFTRTYPSASTFNNIGFVFTPPSVSAGPAVSYCDDSGNQTLTGQTPASGGSWSGSVHVTSGGVFNTNSATVGSYTLTYSYTDGNGCTSSATRVVTVLARPTVNAGADEITCKDSGNFGLGGSPTGGIWSGSPFINGTNFDTNTAPSGVYTLTYTITGANGCPNSDVKTLTVNALPVVSAGPDLNACIGNGNIALTGGSPTGGVWSGLGVSGSTFNPVTAGLGSHPITYTYNDGTCQASDQITITVLSSPTVDAGSNISTCVGSGLIDLTGATPAGGSWSGTAVVGNQFDTGIGSGTYVVTYSYTLPATGCIGTDTRTVVVNNLPTVEAGNNLLNICQTQGEFNLTGFTPSGGVWSGNGLVGPIRFSPSVAGVGTHTLTYTVTNATTGCMNSDFITVVVNAATAVNIGPDRTFCSSNGVYNLNSDLSPSDLGGVWSGTGVNGNNFNPSSTGPGTFTITYSFTNANGCVSTQSKQFTIVLGPVVDAGNALEVCVSNGIVNLVGESPAGGTWSGLGVSGNTFDPLVTGTGIFTVTYTVTTPQCTVSDTRQVVVNSSTPVTAGPNLTVCVNQNDFLLTGASINGGVWTGTGVAGGFFSPATAGVGVHTITYTYTNNKGCISTSTRSITVNAAPVVDAGADISLCTNSGIYSLVGDVSPTGGTFTGTGVQLLNFNPSVAGVGIHQINYTYTSPSTSCQQTDFRFITVLAPATVTIGNNLTVCIDGSPVALVSESIPGGTYSGPGVTGNSFDPTVAGIGVHNIIYDVPDPNGCISRGTRQISVTDLPVVSAGPDIFVCSGTPLVPLNGTGIPIGGTFSGPHVSGGNFSVASSGSGTFQVTYTYTNPIGCTNTAVKNVIVDAGAVVNAGADFSVCVGDPLVDLASRVSPGGGSFVGTGVTGTNFNTSVGVGSYTITYTLNNTFGCAGSDTFVVTVNPLPTVLAGSTRSLCFNEPPYDLAQTAVPSGGSFFGPGVSGNFFTPSSAGVGSHTIFYTFTNGNGCSATATRTLTVTDLPNVNAGSNRFMCIDGPLVDLSLGVTPSNGVWTGPGITSGIFNPAAAGVGTHVATYTITQSNGCTNFDEKVITVFPQLTVDAGPDITVCSNAPVINLNLGASDTGGTWTGTSVSGSNFNPAVGPGNYQVVYTFTNFYGCQAIDTKTILVIAPGSVSVGSDLTVCVTSSSINLATSVFPIGGTFFGTGVQGSTFTPSLAGIGTHPISYTVVDASGCTTTRQRVIQVTPPPAIDAGPNRVICLSSGLFDLDAGSSVTGGMWSGTAVSGSFFNPVVAGIGTHIVSYVYNDGAGCISTDTKSLTVRPDATVDAGINVSVCVNGLAQNFATHPDKQGGIWSGIGMSGSIFNPSVAGPGIHIISYLYTDVFGCSASDTKTVTVFEKPAVSAGSPLTLCTTGTPVNLNNAVFPIGGVWTGAGLSGNFFDPQTVGIGTYQLTYTVTNANGCTNSATRSVTVQLPPVTNVGSNYTVCSSAGLVDLNLISNVSGGVWSGPAVSDGQFDPAVAGLGNHTVTYTFNNGQGCISVATKVIVVRAVPVVNAGSDLSVCLNSGTLSLATQGVPSGGVWSGLGVVSQINFSPSAAGIGAKVLRYTYTDPFGCSVSDNMIITVNSVPIVDAGPNINVCTTAPAINLDLSAFPSGGNWTGPSVIGNQFDPSVGVGNYTINYSYSNSDGCTQVDTRTITVVLPPTVNIGANRILCVNSPRIDLDIGISQVGGSWSGSVGLEGSFFNPLLAGVGTHIVTYTLNNGQGCISTASKTIQVREAITVTAGANRSFCRNSGIYSMTNDPSILGGTFSGQGVSGNNFNPNTAGVGVHIITYTYADEFGCVATAQRQFTVVDIVTVSAGPAITVCVSNGTVDLSSSGFPSGGVWSGQGITGNLFDPGLVGAGVYALTYSYADGNGCSGSASKQVTVSNPPVVEAGSNFDICVNAAPFSLTGASPINGSWSGTGIIAGVFDPLAAGLGVHTLTYSFTDANGCAQSDGIVATVIAEPVLTVGIDLAVCVADTPINLMADASIKGGTFTGGGITGSIFNPSTAQAGTHVVTYTLRFNGCDLTAFRNITVNNIQALDIGGNIELCLDGNNYDLITDVNVIGGVFFGNGVEGTVFKPALAGVGSHVVTYSFTNAFGCSSSAFRVVTVQPELPISAGQDLTICSAVGTIDLLGRGTPSGGVYIGTGVVNNVFNPATSGLGIFDIQYVVDNGNGCVSTDVLRIEVRSSIITNFGVDSIVCVNAEPLPLNFSQELSAGTWTGDGVVANLFYPTLAGVGTHNLTYANAALNCAIAGQRKITVVGLPRAATSNQLTVSGCEGEFITLRAQVSTEDQNNNVNIGWFKEDEEIAFDFGEEIFFQVVGNEKIYYKAVNQFGCNSGQRDYVTVQTNNPSAEIWSNERTVGFGQRVQFAPEKVRSTVSYIWDFGDGITSQEKEPWHFYYESGEKDISLTLVSASGCSTTIREEKWITVLPEPGRGDVTLGLADQVTPKENVLELMAYPNPFRDEVRLQVKSSARFYVDVLITDPVGIAYKIGTVLVDEGDNTLEVDLGQFPGGMYRVGIVSPLGSVYVKVVKL